jgi:hypothetical protein
LNTPAVGALIWRKAKKQPQNTMDEFEIASVFAGRPGNFQHAGA